MSISLFVSFTVCVHMLSLKIRINLTVTVTGVNYGSTLCKIKLHVTSHYSNTNCNYGNETALCDCVYVNECSRVTKFCPSPKFGPIEHRISVQIGPQPI